MAIAETEHTLYHNSVFLTSPTQKNFIMDMERGPRYKAYSELRERKLLMKYLRLQEEEEQEPEKPKLFPTPPRKQVKFQSLLAPASSVRKGSSSFSSSSSSVLAQSVPDFSAALRKENRKPVSNTVMELTPPRSKSLIKGCGGLSSSRGSMSANGGEKRRVFGGGGGGGGGVLMARKSYATMDELKGIFSSAAANAINGESRGGGGRNGRVMGKRTILGYREI